MSLAETGDIASIKQLPFVEHLPDRLDLAEEQLGIVRILQHILDDRADQQLIEATFDYPAPDHSAAYDDTFPGVCRFESAHTAIQFPRSWLDLTLGTANETTTAVCVAMCERLFGPVDYGASMAEVVRRFLVTRNERQIPSLEETARGLALSANQLRKRLYAEGTTYKEITLEVRMTLAKHYLEATALTVQEVAYLLDYSQAPPFSRAFKAYHGYPPSQRRTSV